MTVKSVTLQKNADGVCTDDGYNRNSAGGLWKQGTSGKFTKKLKGQQDTTMDLDKKMLRI